MSEGRLDVAMHAFLAERKVHYTSIDPVRIGIVNESVAPIIAVGLRALLPENGIKDVHIEIRESVVTTFAKMYI